MIPERDELIKGLQAIIFAADAPCEEERLASLLEVPVEEIEGMIEELAEHMKDSALQVVRLAGGYQMATRPRYAGYVQRLREPEPERLSPQALETLAIIAYLGPITRPEIDEIRGVNSTGSVNSLLEKSLVEITGRKDAPGRPFLLQTTSHFLSAFGLHDLSELPELSPSDVDFREQLRGLVSEEMDVEDADLEQLEAEVAEVAEELKEEDQTEDDSAPEQEPEGEDEPR
ncbi:MAG: SMC-Scp complex subunit ScpB [Armatimonadia bacterium]|nr:SMC-Scp complex subunit ScpB [Armatimonadia bacterium]